MREELKRKTRSGEERGMMAQQRPITPSGSLAVRKSKVHAAVIPDSSAMQVLPPDVASCSGAGAVNTAVGRRPRSGSSNSSAGRAGARASSARNVSTERRPISSESARHWQSRVQTREMSAPPRAAGMEGAECAAGLLPLDGKENVACSLPGARTSSARAALSPTAEHGSGARETGSQKERERCSGSGVNRRGGVEMLFIEASEGDEAGGGFFLTGTMLEEEEKVSKRSPDTSQEQEPRSSRPMEAESSLAQQDAEAQRMGAHASAECERKQGAEYQGLQAQADEGVQAHGGVGQEWEAVAAAGSHATPAAPSSCLSLTTRMGQLGVEHPKPEFGIAEEGAEKQDGVEDDTKEEESIDSEQDGEDVREREALVASKERNALEASKEYVHAFVDDNSRSSHAQRQQLTEYLVGLQAKSQPRPGSRDDDGSDRGEDQVEAVIELPANFNEVLAAAEADAIHESERRALSCNAGEGLPAESFFRDLPSFVWQTEAQVEAEDEGVECAVQGPEQQQTAAALAKMRKLDRLLADKTRQARCVREDGKRERDALEEIAYGLQMHEDRLAADPPCSPRPGDAADDEGCELGSAQEPASDGERPQTRGSRKAVREALASGGKKLESDLIQRNVRAAKLGGLMTEEEVCRVNRLLGVEPERDGQDADFMPVVDPPPVAAPAAGEGYAVAEEEARRLAQIDVRLRELGGPDIEESLAPPVQSPAPPCGALDAPRRTHNPLAAARMEREERDKLRDINTKMASLYTPEALARTATAAEIKGLLLDVQRDECLSGVAIGSTDRATVGGRTVATVGGAGEAAADLNELLRQLEAQRAGVFAKTQSPCGIEVSPGREAHEDSRSDLDAGTMMFGGRSADSHPKPPPEACKDTPAPISSVASVPKVGVGSSLPDQRGAEEDENTATVEKMSGAGDASNVVRRGASSNVSASALAVGEGAQYKEAAHRWRSLAERPCSHTSAAAKGPGCVTKSDGRREASQMNASAPARPRSQGRAGVGGWAAGTVDRAALAMRDRRQTALASIGVGTLGHGAQGLELTGSKTGIGVASGSAAMLPGSRPSSSSVSRS